VPRRVTARLAARDALLREPRAHGRRRCGGEPRRHVRREGIPLLIEHFRILFNGKYALAIEGLAPVALAAMMAHEWPGNVRALAKVLKEDMILREEGWVQQGDLRIASGARLGQSAAAGGGPAQPAVLAGPPPPASERQEAALRIAQEQGAVNRRQLAAQFGVSGETARLELSILTRMGFLRQVGKGPAARYVLA